MMEEFRSQDEWRHIWWMIEKENTLNWWSHQNSWISIKLKSLAKVRLVIALSTNHAFDFFEHYLRNLTSVLVWAASPRGSYWVRKQTQSQREMGRWERRQRKGWELRLNCPGSAWAGVTWAQLSLTPGRSSDQAKRCHWEVFLLERRTWEKEDNSFILIGVQAGRAICFSSIGQFDAKAASKHFNLSWHFHLSHINPHSRPPDNICSFICTVPH